MFGRRLLSVTRGLRSALRQGGHRSLSEERHAWTDARGRTHFGPATGGTEVTKKYLYYAGFAAGGAGLIYVTNSEKVRTYFSALSQRNTRLNTYNIFFIYVILTVIK